MTTDELNAYAAAEHAALLAKMEKRWEKAVLPEPQLWAPGEIEKTQDEVAAAAAAIPKYPQHNGRPNLAEEEEPGDATGDLAHIRELILADFPNAATVTDEELEALYDEWAAQHGE